MRRVLVPLSIALALLPSVSDAKRSRLDNLMSVVTPSHRGTASAHPWVNVIVSFGAVRNAKADPSTFRAHIGRTEITDRFRLTTRNGTTVMEARLATPLLRLGRRVNRLRFVVQAQGSGKGKRKRDVDRIRFRAVDAPNQAPTARLIEGSESIVPGVPTQFIGSRSTDPDSDSLDYLWDFGDGTTSTEADPVHVFAARTDDLTVRLTVSDERDADSDEAVLYSCPPTDPGRVPGQIRLDAEQAPEFGGVALGATRTLRFNVTNQDDQLSTQLNVRLGVHGAAFTVDPPTLSLEAGKTAAIALTFAPQAGGHQSADVVVVAGARNGCVFHVLAHGYGGIAPESGPTLAPSTAFFTNTRGQPAGITAAGTRFTVDNSVHQCLTDSGTGSRDPCVATRDCGTAGERCVPTTQSSFEPVDMCTDGRGHLYLLSDDVFTDRGTTGTEVSVGILDLKLDANGTRTDANLLRKTTTQTGHIACDRLPGGSVYIPEYREIDLGTRCFRDAQENLLSVNRASGAAEVLYRQLDAIEGLAECDDDVDPLNDLEAMTTADGLTRLYGTFDSSFDVGGLYQLVTLSGSTVTPRPVLFSADIRDFFQVHPDGSVLYVTRADEGPRGILSLYRISPGQVTNGPLALSTLTPCATIETPNNQGRTFIDPDAGSYAIAQVPGTSDGVMLLSFTTTGGRTVPLQYRGEGIKPILPQGSPLARQGTYAISVAANGGACAVLGLVNQEFLSGLRL